MQILMIFVSLTCSGKTARKDVHRREMHGARLTPLSGRQQRDFYEV